MGDLSKKSWRDLAGYTSPTTTHPSYNSDQYNYNDNDLGQNQGGGYQSSEAQEYSSWSPKESSQEWGWNNEQYKRYID